MLTKGDLNQVRIIVEDTVDKKLLSFETRAITPLSDEIDDLRQGVKFLPTKDEFYGKMDEVMGELKTIREEQTANTGRFADYEDRITRLEETHPDVVTP